MPLGRSSGRGRNGTASQAWAYSRVVRLTAGTVVLLVSLAACASDRETQRGGAAVATTVPSVAQSWLEPTTVPADLELRQSTPGVMAVPDSGAPPEVVISRLWSSADGRRIVSFAVVGGNATVMGKLPERTIGGRLVEYVESSEGHPSIRWSEAGLWYSLQTTGLSNAELESIMENMAPPA